MANEYLQRTPTVTGNTRVFTISCWLKHQYINGSHLDILHAYDGSASNRFQLMLQPSYELSFFSGGAGDRFAKSVSDGGTGYANFRDSSAWMHVVGVMNTTAGEEGQRCKIYINGVERSLIDASNGNVTGINFNGNPDQVNAQVIHHIMGVANDGQTDAGTSGCRAQLCDYFFVDGQALTAEVFGFFKDGDGYQSSGTTQATDFRSGQWSPRLPKSIKHEINRGGGFGVNGFYLPFNDSSNPGADFHCTPNSIIKLKGEDEPQPRNGAPTTSDSFVSQLRDDPYAANLILAVPFISHPTGSNLLTVGTFSSTSGWSLSDAAAPTISGGKLIYDGTSGNGFAQRAEAPAVITSGNYYIVKLTVTRTSGTLQVRIGNGSYSNTISESGNYTITVKAGSTPTETILLFGNSFNGTVDDLQIYQQDTIKDYSADIKGSGTNKTVTVKGTFSVGDCPSYYGSALLCNPGADGYVEVAANADFANLEDVDHTIEFWYKNDSWDGSYLPHHSIIGLRENTSQVAWRFAFTDKNSVNEDGIQLFGTNGFNTGAFVLNNDWNHCAVEQYNDRVTIYVNGFVAGQNAGPVGYPAYKTSQGPIIIGTDPRSANLGDTYSFNGQMQDVRIYKGVAKYKGGFDVPKPYTPKGIEGFRTTADTCKNTFVTMNGNNKSGCTLSNGDLTTADSTSSGGQIYSTMGSNTGKWYYEAHVTDVGGPGGQLIGINPLRRPAGNVQNRTAYRSSGDVYNDSGSVQQTGTTYTTGDIIGVAWDADAKKLWFAKNGSWVYSGDPVNGGNQATAYTSTETQGPFMAYDNGAISQVTDFNFGQNPTFSGHVSAGTNTDGNGKGLFKYAPPTGFLALCTDNLPTPAIADPGKHFKAVLWNGDGKTGRAITKVGFQPDFVWIANRDRTTYKPVFDSVRGARKMLRSSAMSGEGAFDTVLQSFDPDGFTVGDDGAHNYDGERLVAWCWKAGGAAVSNGNGTITSQVSANQTAGFSIVSYTGNSTDNATVGHGLLKVPDMIIVKNRDLGVAWGIWHSSMATGEVLRFSTTLAQVPGTAYFQDELNTSSVFGLGTNDETNVNDNYIAYCWHAVDGYSKFGNYIGNGDANGPFVYCGFKPAWLIVKCRTADNGNWVIYDNARSSKNVNGLRLGANITDSENENDTNLGVDSSVGVDFLSNGFKIRTTGVNHNSNQEEYIYAAFAESPYQTANAK